MHERVFERDGVQVSTAVPAQAVRLLSEGYREVTDDEPSYSAGSTTPVSGTAHLYKGERVVRPPTDERNSVPD